MGKLYFLSVGCGNFTIIQSTNGKTVLVDCGDDNQTGYNFSHLLPNDRIIDAVFITHQHFDHFRRLANLLVGQYHIDMLFYSPYEIRRNDPSVDGYEWAYFEVCREELEKKGTNTSVLYRQANFDHPVFDIDDMKFYILGPDRYVNTHHTRKIHEASLVILAELGQLKCIFPGDASISNLNRIAINPHLPHVDILLASHHGSRDGADNFFVNKCDPDIIVLSTTSGMGHNFPHAEAMAIYAARPGRRILRTDQDHQGMGYLEFSW